MFVLELIVAITIPDPVSAQALQLELERSFLFLQLDCFSEFGVSSKTERLFGCTCSQWRIVNFWLILTQLRDTKQFHLFCFFFLYFSLSIPMIAHSLNRLESYQSRHRNLHGIQILFQQIIFG